MSKREALVRNINQLVKSLTISKLSIIEILMKALQGDGSRELQSMIEEFLEKVAPPKVVATGEYFHVEADKNSFVATSVIRLKKSGGMFDNIGDLFHERMLDKGNRVEGSCEGYKLQTYQLLDMVSDEIIIESLRGRSSIEVTLRGFSNYISNMIKSNSQVNGRSYIAYIEDKYSDLMVVNVHFNLEGEVSIFAAYIQNPRNWSKGDIVVVPCP